MHPSTGMGWQNPGLYVWGHDAPLCSASSQHLEMPLHANSSEVPTSFGELGASFTAPFLDSQNTHRHCRWGSPPLAESHCSPRLSAAQE